MGYAERRRAREQYQAAPSFEVVSGGGLDAKVRSGASAEFLTRVAIVCSIALVLLVIGAARVVLSTATVQTLRANATLRSEVSDAQTLNDELKIERSVLGSSTRIGRIATQNYGMVLSSETLSVDIAADQAGDAADQAADAESAAQGDASSQQLDGDAAQASEAAMSAQAEE